MRRKLLFVVLWVMVLLLFGISSITGSGQTPLQVTEIPICTDPTPQNYPAIYGDKIVWQDYRNGHDDIYMYDLSVDSNNNGIPNYLENPRPNPDPAEVRITWSPSQNTMPSIWENRIVYRKDQTITVYDLVTKIEIQLPSGSSTLWPKIFGDNVVWPEEENWAGNWGWRLYTYNLITKEKAPVSPAGFSAGYSPSNFAIYEDKIVWVGTPDTSSGWKPYVTLYDIPTKTNRVVAYTDSAYDVSIWKDRVVWDSWSGGPFINVLNLSTGATTTLNTTYAPGYLPNPVIQEDRIAYLDGRNGNADIYMYDLSNSTETPITTDPGAQDSVAIFGDKVVWRTWPTTGWLGNTDIYMAVVSNPSSPPPDWEPGCFGPGCHEGPPPSLDTGFQPNRDGYQFVNRPAIPDWELFEDTFGEQGDPPSSYLIGDLTPAQIFYLVIYSRYCSVGNCYGMATTGGLFFNGWKNSDFNNLKIQYPDVFINCTYDFPDPYQWWYSFTLWPHTPIADYIRKYQGYQLDGEIFDYLQKEEDTLSNTLNKLEKLESQPQILNIYWDDKGHSLLPYAMSYSGDTVYVKVYDPNNPGDTNCVVEIHKTGNWYWYYNGFGGLDSRQVKNPLLYTTPLELDNNAPILPDRCLWSKLTSLTGAAHLLYVDDAGNELGYKNGEFVDNVPGARRIAPLTQEEQTNFPENYVLSGSQEYSAILSGSDTGPVDYELFGTNSLISINTYASPSTTDNIQVSTDNNSLTYTTNETNKSFSASIYRELPEVTRSFTVLNAALSNDGPVTMQVNPDGNTLAFTNNGGAKTYNLKLNQIGGNSGSFSYPDLKIETNEIAEIEVQDWNRLESTQITLLVEDLDGNVKQTQILQGDTIPPTTTISLDGIRGESDWCVSDVTVALTTVDNEGGSGVAKTEYSLDNGNVWNTYTGHFTLDAEGTTTILARSTDNAGNVESPSVLSIVKIDKTSPEAVMQFNPNTRDLVINGTDNLTNVNVNYIETDHHCNKKHSYRCRTYTLSDEAGNTLILEMKIKKKTHEIKAQILSLSYNGSSSVIPPKNILKFKWFIQKDGTIKWLAQKLGVKGCFKVRAMYQRKKNITTIKIKQDNRRGTITQPGLALLKLKTLGSNLIFEY